MTRTTRPFRPASFLLALCLYAFSTLALADSKAEVEALLTGAESPVGVVFEVVSGNEGKLDDLMPTIRDYSERLRERFPDIEVAVVTHGSEQFSLLASNEKLYPGLHAEIESLVKEDNVPVHVCGGHASWRDNVPEDFPKYVDVAPSGPAQIRDYEKLGYVLIIL